VLTSVSTYILFSSFSSPAFDVNGQTSLIFVLLCILHVFSVIFRICKGIIYFLICKGRISLENKYMRGQPTVGMNEENTAHVAAMVKECLF
jgi:hypothetical protein